MSDDSVDIAGLKADHFAMMLEGLDYMHHELGYGLGSESHYTQNENTYNEALSWLQGIINNMKRT